MKFYTTKETFLPALLAVCGIVERKQTMPILSNLLLHAEEDTLTLTSTDLDIEMTARCPVKIVTAGSSTLPARKLVDICRNLTDDVAIEINDEAGAQAFLKAGRGRYKLQSLPADQFPNLDPLAYLFEFPLAQFNLHTLLNRTQFSMAVQDVRYYLNGLLLEITTGQLKAVATDAHRLAVATTPLEIQIEDVAQFILPRKAVQELHRILNDDEALISCRFGQKHITFLLPNVTFTTKLIDSKYANYARVIPEFSTCDHEVLVNRAELQQILTRVAILSHEKIKGVNLFFANNTLTVQSYNSENEEAEEIIDVDYTDEDFALTFNGSYVSDFLGISTSEFVRVFTVLSTGTTILTDSDSAVYLYVVMPMKH